MRPTGHPHPPPGGCWRAARPDVVAPRSREYATAIEFEGFGLTATLERTSTASGSAQLNLARLAVGAAGRTRRAEAREGGSASEDLPGPVSGDPLAIGANSLLWSGEPPRSVGRSRLRIQPAGRVAPMRLTGGSRPVGWQWPLPLAPRCFSQVARAPV